MKSVPLLYGPGPPESESIDHHPGSRWWRFFLVIRRSNPQLGLRAIVTGVNRQNCGCFTVQQDIAPCPKHRHAIAVASADSDGSEYIEKSDTIFQVFPKKMTH